MNVNRASNLPPHSFRNFESDSVYPEQILNCIPFLRCKRLELKKALGQVWETRIRQRIETCAHPFTLGALARRFRKPQLGAGRGQRLVRISCRESADEWSENFAKCV